MTKKGLTKVVVSTPFTFFFPEDPTGQNTWSALYWDHITISWLFCIISACFIATLSFYYLNVPLPSFVNKINPALNISMCVDISTNNKKK